tara:strand:+ start:147 stop:683 length:537 start_codon:yes stop_codon:yes gene_type:complete
MDELLSSFQELGEILLEHLLDVEGIIVSYELMMEVEDMEIMNDLYAFFSGEEQENVNQTNENYNEFINDFQGSLGTMNQVSAQLLNQRLVQEQALFSDWMELVLEYPEPDIDNIHVEVLRAIDIIESCMRFIETEKQRLLVESKKRLSTSKLLSDRLASSHLDLIDPLLLARIMEGIR